MSPFLSWEPPRRYSIWDEVFSHCASCILEICKLLRRHLPDYFLIRSPVILPAGSENMANLGPPGTSVGGRIVLAPRYSARSSVACKSLACAYNRGSVFEDTAY